MANGEGFEEAVRIAKETSDFANLGIHLNIIEGKSLIFNSKSAVTDENGCYNLSFVDMLLKSGNKEFLDTVEKEFRSQIEKVLATGLKPCRLNSHVHTHAIPNIFELTCKLAKEYGIKDVRTQSEIPYTTGQFRRHLNVKYLMNIIKNVLLNFLNLKNKSTIKKYDLTTTDYFIGVLYTGNMDEKTIISGIKRLPENCTAEIILHPTLNKEKADNYREYLALTASDKLKEFVNSLRQAE